MLAFLLRKIDVAKMVPEWSVHTFVFLTLGLAVTAAGIVLSTLRWWTVLSALGLRAKVRTLLNHYLAGLFVGNFLPSTIGGDVLRVTRQAADNGDRASTFASVVLERLTGWLVLPVITLVALAINPGLRSLGTATTLAVSISCTTLVLLSILLFAAGHPRLGGRLAESEGWQRFLGAVHLGVARFRTHPGAVANVVLVGFAYQLAVVASAYMAARALDLDVGPTAILAFMPAVAIAQVLPISVSGIGLREGALVLFLRPLGVPDHDAIALGLLFYGMNLVVSLLGAPSFAVGGGRRAAANAIA